MAEFFTDEQIKACIDEPKPLPIELAALTPPLRRTTLAVRKRNTMSLGRLARTTESLSARVCIICSTSLSSWRICRRLPTRCFGCVVTMGKAMSTPIRSNVIDSTASTCTRPHSVTRSAGLKEDGFAEPTDRYSDPSRCP